MVTTFAIQTVMKIVNGITGPMRQAAASTRQFRRRFRRDLRGAQMDVRRLAASIRTQLGGALRFVAGAGLLMLAGGLAMATGEFVKFDDALTAAAARFSDVKKSPAAVAAAMAELGKVARKVGAETQFSAAEAAKGLDFLAMAGFQSKQAMALLPPVTDLATAANIDLARATDIASDALGAFGLATDDPIKLAQNMARVNDVLAKTVTTSNTDLEMLFETIKNGAPDFKAAGQSIETFSALVGTLASSGMKGSKAGVSMRNMMLRLANTTPKARKELDKMGITIEKEGGGFKDAIQILAELERGTAKMGEVERTAALGRIFGARTITAMNILLEKGSDAIGKYRAELKDSTGAGKQMAEVMRRSLGNRLKILKSTLIDVGFRFLDSFKDTGVDAITALTNAFRDFDPKPVADAIITAATGIAKMWRFTKPLIPTIITLIAVFKAYKVTLMIVAAAQMAFNAAAAANPLGMLTIAIFATIAGLTLLIVHWDDLTRKMEESPGFRILAGLVAGLLGLFTPLHGLFASVTMAYARFDAIIDNSLANFRALDQIFMDLESVFDDLPLGLDRMAKGLIRIARAAAQALTPITALSQIGKVVTETLFKSREEKKEALSERRAGDRQLDRDLAAQNEFANFFGMGDPALAGAAGAISQSITEKTSNAFLTITDETGRGELSGGQGGLPPNIKLEKSGGE